MVPHSPSAGQSHSVTISTWTILKVVLVLMALGLLWLLQDVVTILILALLLAALIDPFADWFAKRRIPRSLAVLIVYVVFLVFAAFAFFLIVPLVVHQIQQFIGNFSSTYASIAQSVGHVQSLSVEHGLGRNLQAGLEGLQEGANASVGRIFSTLTGFVGGIATFLIVLVLAFYMVVEKKAARHFFKELAPSEYQPFLGNLFVKMQERIGAWLRGQLILALVIGCVMYVGLILLGVPYALVLGLVAGLFEIVPYAGPMLAAVPILLVAFSISPFKGLIALALIVGVQQVENHVLTPKIMQKTTGLNPIISIVAVLVGLKIGGLVGGLLGIPVAAMLAVVAEHLFALRPFAPSDDVNPSV